MNAVTLVVGILLITLGLVGFLLYLAWTEDVE
jgi:preprotein translocase subunit Sss1